MDYRHIEVKPVAGALGAEIEGVDLAAPLDDETFAEIRQTFLDHLVIFFRDQKVTPDQHKAFGRRFGTLNIHPYVKAMGGHEEIIEIVKEKDDKVNFGGGWHTDVSFLEKPALGSVLLAREVPESGGDTMFANQYLAYETLSDGMKELLDGMVAVHSAGSQYGRQGESQRNRDKRGGMQLAVTEVAEETTEHPVVRTHPETGRKALYVNGAFTERFKGMTKAESAPLLRFLFKHAVQPEFTCRFRWAENSIAFWDNRCAQHYALNDYAGQRRHMQRVTINGDRPF